MIARAARAACLVCLAALPARAEEQVPRRPVVFAEGTTTATVEGRIEGRQTVDHVVRARAGQTMTVTLQPSSRMAYFNVLPPGTEEAIFVGASGGSRFSGKLPADGDYALRVYLVRAAARRNESAKYVVTVSVEDAVAPARAPGSPAGAPAAGASSAGPFEKTLELLGVTFRVVSPNSTTGNTVKIVPSGLEADDAPVERAVDGVVTGAEVADLDADRSPEVYVYVRGPGSEARGALVAFSANRKKSLSDIFMPDLSEQPGATEGYRGHDEMAVVEGVLARRFPVYGKGGDPTAPTGKTRQLQYVLRKGEASWVLRVDDVVEF